MTLQPGPSIYLAGFGSGWFGIFRLGPPKLPGQDLPGFGVSSLKTGVRSQTHNLLFTTSYGCIWPAHRHNPRCRMLEKINGTLWRPSPLHRCLLRCPKGARNQNPLPRPGLCQSHAVRDHEGHSLRLGLHAVVGVGVGVVG